MRDGKGHMGATDLHGQIVGSEGEVVPTNKTRVLRSHVHLQVLEEVNILWYVCIKGRTSGYSSRHNGLQNEPCR